MARQPGRGLRIGTKTKSFWCSQFYTHCGYGARDTRFERAPIVGWSIAHLHGVHHMRAHGRRALRDVRVARISGVHDAMYASRAYQVCMMRCTRRAHVRRASEACMMRRTHRVNACGCRCMIVQYMTRARISSVGRPSRVGSDPICRIYFGVLLFY